MTSQQQLDDRRKGEPSQVYSDELHVRELMYARLYVCGTQRTDATRCVWKFLSSRLKEPFPASLWVRLAETILIVTDAG